MYIPILVVIAALILFAGGNLDALFMVALIYAACHFWYISIPVVIIFSIIYIVLLLIAKIPNFIEDFIEFYHDIKNIDIRKIFNNLKKRVEIISYKNIFLIIIKSLINVLLGYFYLLILTLPMILLLLLKNELLISILLFVYILFAIGLVVFMFIKKSDKIFIPLKK